MYIRHLLRVVLLGALLGGAGSVNASVIYNWVPISNSSDIHSTNGSLEVTDDAYLSGRLDIDYNTAVFGPVPDSPLLTFTFDVNGGVAPLKIMPRGSDGVIQASLVLTDNLEGSIAADDLQAQIELNGDPQQWFINRFGSDGGGTGCSYMPCSGATGVWRVDESTVPAVTVPEPPIGLLFGTGVGILGLSRRRLKK